MAYADQITLDIVSSAAGIAGRSQLFELVAAVSNGDAANAVKTVDELYNGSKDLTRLAFELIEQFRNIMMIKALPESQNSLAALPEELKILCDIADKLSLQKITSLIMNLQQLSESLAKTPEKRTVFDIGLIKLCSDIPTEEPAKSVSDTRDSHAISLLTERIKHLEARLAQITNLSEPQKPPAAAKTNKEQNPRAGVPDMSKLSIDDFSPLPEWAEFLERFNDIEPHIAATLSGSRAIFYENILLIYAQNKFFLELIKRKENAERLQSVLKSITGKQFIIRAKCTEPAAETPLNPAEAIIRAAEQKNIPTTTIE
jgi:DNA polymerase-3 subunit gamma/tau